MTIHHIDAFFDGSDSNKIYEQCWIPEDFETAKGILIVVHGLAEHGGSYEHIGQFFAKQGFIVGALDHRSHGKSDGKNTEYNHIDELVEDLAIFVTRMRERLPQSPIFMFGHSMGGLITTHFVIKKQPDFNGILLTGPGLKISDDVAPFLLKISGIGAKLMPHLKTIILDKNAVSRDPITVEKYDTDPLNYREGIPACTAHAMNSGIKEINSRYGEFQLPVLVMHGTEDHLADPEGSKDFYHKISSEDKQLKLYEGMYHALVHEPEKDDIINDMLTWIEERL